MEAIFEAIFEGILTGLIPLIGGFFIDLFLKALNYKISWGFAQDKNPVLSAIAFFILFMIPLGIYNEFSTSSLFMLFGLFCGVALLIQASYGHYEEPKELSNILDENCKEKNNVPKKQKPLKKYP
ncbi:MAG: hypothetical protein ACI976_002964 [Aureispira sp.]|jgi:hypothetical protein